MKVSLCYIRCVLSQQWHLCCERSRAVIAGPQHQPLNQAEEAPKQIRKYQNTATHLIGHTWHTRALLSKNTFRDTHCELDSEQHKQMTSELCFVYR